MTADAGKAVLFGAGNIGRGFIGLTLAQAGFGLVFVDIDQRVVDALRGRGAYDVVLAGGDRRTARVERATAVSGRDRDAVAEAVATADLAATAIGVTALPHIAETLAEGIRRRIARSDAPLAVIACENAIGASGMLRRHVESFLTDGEKELLDRQIFFPNAAVDRIVPAQQHDDPLTVTVEPFAEWVVERPRAEREVVPRIDGLHVADDLEPYISRKLFTVNTGHCSAAYYGYLRRYETIQQAMADPALRGKVRAVLEDTGAVLCRMYGFDPAAHRAYIDRTLERFANPWLTDSVIRVGRSPLRKLSPEDRLVKPLKLGHGLGIPAPHLIGAIAAALRFDHEADPEAVELRRRLREEGVRGVVARHLDIPPDHPLHGEIVRQYETIGGIGHDI